MPRLNKRMLEYAVQQFIGYAAALEGPSLDMLIESMGLTKREYEAIKDEIPQRLRDEADEHFRREERV